MTQRDLSSDETLAVTQLAATRPAGPTPDSSLPGADLPGAAVSVSVAPPEPSCARQVLGGRYELHCLVGSGGMGNVYYARDLELDEVVALKTLRREIADNPGVIERFRREVRLARRVTHPNVARVFDIGEHDGDKFLTMEYIQGEPLADVIAREGALRIDRAVEITRAVCAGLGAAHKAGVIHRDLKPENVLIAKDGRVVLTDFGIARAFDVSNGPGGGSNTMGVTVGTPAYMAPEQVQGREDIDGRADIYALGAMLFEMFTGQRAWRGDGAFAVAAAKLIQDPPDPRTVRPDLPASFARLILRCMARDRDARFPTAEAVADELGTLTQPAAARAPGSGPARATVGEIAPPPAPQAASAGDKIVAVLPFRNQGTADDDFLAEELTDDLIDTLSMTAGLKVRPRGVVSRYKGADQDPREVGRELGVQVVVDGTVRRRAGAIRISARLISVADGFQLWARRLDRPEQDVLKMSDEVAQAIAEALTLDAKAAPAREGPADPIAVDLYLRARHEYRKYWPPNLHRSIELYEQALARAPNDPLILSACAVARCRMWFFTGEGVDRVTETVERALAVAPDLAEPRFALATIRLQEGDGPTAVRELKRALARSPSLAEAHGVLSMLLLEANDLAEGIRWAESALALDPLTPLVRAALARAYVMLGRWDDMIAMLEAGRQLGDEQWGIRARFISWRRDVSGAEELLEEMQEQDSGAPMAKALLHVLRDREIPHDAPEVMIGEVGAHHAARRRAFMYQLRAEVQGFLGNREETLAAVKGAVEAKLLDLAWMERCPALDDVRADPRFAPLLATVRRRAEAILEAYRER